MALPWIVLFTPLLSAAIILLLTRSSRNISALVSVAAVLVSFIGSCILFGQPDATEANRISWISVGNFQLSLGITLDQLSKTMLIVVTSIGALVHIYSLGYMKDDEGKSRFFAGLSLFMFSMLGIVLADNFVMMFLFWELVGVSSYILIGHWFFKNSAAAAANKAFITNRIGDFGFIIGILMLWVATGSVVFKDIESSLGTLTQNPQYLTIAVLLVFCGTVGKSAQFPLHVWLPDAMEGPTPVSALIHAATMVAAGVYMLARVFFLVEVAPNAQEIIAWIGIGTAVLAAFMATQQNDIKRILAYSTLSQLGYMVMAIGVGSSVAAMFHLFTHAFFKALLFLGAGSVIHAVHHEQDIWKMGGLKNKMPITFLTFALGTFALTGFPFLFSGFYSKDMILLAAHAKSAPIFWLALGTAFLTAFYMFRLFVVVFLGGPKSDAAKHGHESPKTMTLPLVILAIPSIIAGFPFFIHYFIEIPHEEHSFLVPGLAIGSFVLGTLSAFLLYSNKTKDPIYIPLLANKFYIDEIYTVLIRATHDLLAKISAWVDRWILDGAIVRGIGGATWGFGFVLRFLQMGNLQAYAFLFGAGIVAFIYIILK